MELKGTIYYALFRETRDCESTVVAYPTWEKAMARAEKEHARGCYYATVCDNRNNYWKEFWSEWD